MALTIGKANSVKSPMIIAFHSLSILNIDAPRYANTNASHMYPTVSKANPVPF